MGKGDKKSRRGKIITGTFGVSRPRKKNTEAIVPTAEKISKPVAEKIEKPKAEKTNKKE